MAPALRMTRSIKEKLPVFFGLLYTRHFIYRCHGYHDFILLLQVAGPWLSPSKFLQIQATLNIIEIRVLLADLLALLLRFLHPSSAALNSDDFWLASKAPLLFSLLMRKQFSEFLLFWTTESLRVSVLSWGYSVAVEARRILRSWVLCDAQDLMMDQLDYRSPSLAAFKSALIKPPTCRGLQKSFLILFV